MKKGIIIVLILLLGPYAFTFPSSHYNRRTETGMSMGLTPVLGAFTGIISEYAYSGGKLLSRLDWELDPLIYAGATITFNFTRFWITAGYRGGLPLVTGFMEDSDWEGLDSVKTKYSRHDNKCVAAHFADVRTGVPFWSSKTITIGGFLGFNFSHISMKAADGFRQYPPGSVPVATPGTVVLYSQSHFSPLIGANGTFYLTREFFMTAALALTPFHFCEAIDRHVLRDLEFHDSVSFAFYLEIDVSFNYHFTERLSLNLNIGYRHIPETKGKSYTVTLTTGAVSATAENGAGIGMNALDVALGVSTVFSLEPIK